MDWTVVISVFAAILANVGTIIALHLHLDKKIDESRKESNDILKAIREEIKDFHDAMKDFHGRMCAIEERNKK